MPHSDERLRPWVLGELWRLTDPARQSDPDFFRAVTDCGAGVGGWLDFLKPHMPEATFTGIEVWRPYITKFRLAERYDSLIFGDVRHVDLPVADLTVFGDVLEHMPADDALAAWEKARKVSSWLVACLPVLRYEQGPLNGNPFEVHVHHWDEESVLASFSGIVAHHGPPEGTDSVSGAFIAEGLR